MPILSVDKMNVSLDNDYDAVEVEVALFVGDPSLDGVELDSVDNPGYARTSIPVGGWDAAEGGAKSAAAVVQFPAATGEWLDEATHWALFEPGDVDGWDYGVLSEPLVVSGAGDGPQVAVTVFYDDSVEVPA